MEDFDLHSMKSVLMLSCLQHTVGVAQLPAEQAAAGPLGLATPSLAAASDASSQFCSTKLP